MKTWQVRLFVVPFLVIVVYGSITQWQAQRYVLALEQGDIALQEARDWPLHSEPSLVAARLMLLQGRSDPETIRGHLQHTINARPLYAPAYLDLAELEWREGNLATALEQAQYSQLLWPTRRRHLWRLGQFYLKLGQVEAALESLSIYLLANSNRAAVVISMLSKLGIDPELIAAILIDPVADAPEELHVSMALEVLKAAAGIRELGLANAWWDRLPDSLRMTEPFVRAYVGLGLTLMDIDATCRAWLAGYPLEPCRNSLRNGDFSEPLRKFGLGWTTLSGKGFRISRNDGNQARIQIEFDGSENLQFQNVQQWIPIEAEGGFRLAASWQGDNVTTRSGVYLQVRVSCEQGGHAVRSDSRYGSWERERIALEFDVTGKCPLAQVGIGRDRTSALDSRLSGTVWLSDFTLEGPIQPEQQHE